LERILDYDTARKIKRVIITGCGDSYSAAGAMLPAFKAHSGLRLASAPDPMDFCRFYSEDEVRKGNLPDETLVVAVSQSGGSARIVEILEKANGLNVLSMLISNSPESKGAKAAKLMYNVETPSGCNTPGLRSYFASMIAINALGAYIGLSRGHITLERFFAIKDAIVNYTQSFMEQERYERVDDLMFDVSKTWKDFEKFEIIGDFDEGFSAQFVEEKFIECAGVHTTHADSEDWCHINYFLRDPKTIGTVFMVNSKAPDFDRVVYAVRSSTAIGRPTLVVTDANASEFPAEAIVCEIPSPDEAWLMPIMDFAPGSILAAYVAAVADKFFFGGRYDYRTQKWNFGGFA
ncbi:MAG: SIS domain-containing protein, partial [Oscillospiraceae bacterium]|nr:SIS domain-containing protein [Oscillospiraceae bacterium]